MWSSTRASCRSSSASRTMSGRCSPARNAAWPSRATRTCAPATSSSATGWRRCSARCEFEAQACAYGFADSCGFVWISPSAFAAPMAFAHLIVLVGRSAMMPHRDSRYKIECGPVPARAAWLAERGQGELIMQKRSAHHPGPSQRALRAGEVIRHAMAEILARGDVHDPVIETHLITVPEVRMSPDLRLATVYVMPLG